MRHGDLAVAQVQVGPADPAGPDAHDDLPGSRLRPGQLDGAQGGSGGGQDHGAHQSRIILLG